MYRLYLIAPAWYVDLNQTVSYVQFSRPWSGVQAVYVDPDQMYRPQSQMQTRIRCEHFGYMCRPWSDK